MIASCGPASSTSQPWAPRPWASCSTFSATPPSGGSKASSDLGMLPSPPRGAEERAELVLALAVAAAADGVDGHEVPVENGLRVEWQAPLRRGDDAGAPDPEAGRDDAEREPQVLADQRPPRRVAVQVPGPAHGHQGAAGEHVDAAVGLVAGPAVLASGADRAPHGRAPAALVGDHPGPIARVARRAVRPAGGV